jgi:UDP-N-acetylmuramoyl-tripeptide--D-alanyl-D-alanine ligase
MGVYNWDMKSSLLKCLSSILIFLSKLILKKYSPKIVGVTGSVGKTTTKEAIYTILKKEFNTRTSIKNYNNELGIPLTIIGEESGGSSITGWLKVFMKAIKLLLTNVEYPEVLVLEMGIDRIGEMEMLMRHFKPDISVVTAVSKVHLEFMGSIDNIAHEKSQIVTPLSEEDFAVLNGDNSYVYKMREKTKAQVLSYGMKSNEVDLYAHDVKNSIEGLSFSFEYNDKKYDVQLDRSIGSHLVYSTLAAIGVGINMGIEIERLVENIKDYKAPLGRMNIIEGINDSVIIDDTYNSSVDSSIAAMDLFDEISDDRRRIVVLGDMLELGEYEKEAHEYIGSQVVERRYDFLLTFGPRAKMITEKAQSLGMNNALHFENKEELVNKLKDIISKGDVLLIKGSQGVRMELVTKAVMKNPEKAKDLLTRQYGRWII